MRDPARDDVRPDTSSALVPAIDKQLALRNKGVGTELAAWFEKCANVYDQAKRADIDTEADYGRAGDLAKTIAKLDATMNETRKQWTTPFRNITTLINAAFASNNQALEEASGAIRSKMRAFQEDREREARKEAAERRRLLEEEALARAEAASDGAEQDAVLEAAATASEELEDRMALGPTIGGFSSTSKRKVVTGEVTDIEKFIASVSRWHQLINPEDILNLKKGGVNKLAKRVLEHKDIKSIPGLTISESSDITVR